MFPALFAALGGLLGGGAAGAAGGIPGLLGKIGLGANAGGSLAGGQASPVITGLQQKAAMGDQPPQMPQAQIMQSPQASTGRYQRRFTGLLG